MGFHQPCLGAVEYVEAGSRSRVDLDQPVSLPGPDEVCTAEAQQAGSIDETREPALDRCGLAAVEALDADCAAVTVRGRRRRRRPLAAEANDLRPLPVRNKKRRHAVAA